MMTLLTAKYLSFLFLYRYRWEAKASKRGFAQQRMWVLKMCMKPIIDKAVSCFPQLGQMKTILQGLLADNLKCVPSIMYVVSS